MDPDSDLIRIRSSKSREVLLNPGALAAAIRQANLSPGRETGGVLLGRFTGDKSVPIIYKCLPSTSDCQHSRASFSRGTRGLATLLRREFVRGYQYIGEWHTHPDGPSQPSCRDHLTMARIARSACYQIADPLLMILSGSEARGWKAAVRRYNKMGVTDRFAEIEASAALLEHEL